MNKDFCFQSIGELSTASGENWYYHRQGKIMVFKQNGKVPSLRVIKTLIKLLEKGNKDD